MQKIILSTIEHKGKAAYQLHFTYDATLKEQLKALPYVAWSATHKCFYAFCDAITFKTLYKNLRDMNLYVDYSALQKTRAVPTTAKTNSPLHLPQLAESTQRDLSRFVRWMQEKRLAASTVIPIRRLPPSSFSICSLSRVRIQIHYGYNALTTTIY